MNQRKAALEAARLGQHRHVRRQRAAVGVACRLIVGERRRKMIGEAARPLEHFALVVRAVLDLELGCDSRRLLLGEARAAGIGEVAERQELEAVAGGADLAIDLEAALELLRVVHAERPGERPALPRRRLLLLRHGRAPDRHCNESRKRQADNDGATSMHGRLSSRPWRPRAAAPTRRREALRAIPIPRSSWAKASSSRTGRAAAG